MRRAAAAVLALLILSPLAGGAASPRPLEVRRSGAAWLSADVEVPRGARLVVEGRLLAARARTADACYAAIGDRVLGSWLRLLPGDAGELRCRAEVAGPASGRLLVVLAAREPARRSTFRVQGGKVRRWRAGPRVVLLRERELDPLRPGVVTFRGDAFAFASTGPARGAALLGQSGPSEWSSWRAGGRAWAVDGAWLLRGRPGRYEFSALLAGREWAVLAVADVR